MKKEENEKKGNKTSSSKKTVASSKNGTVKKTIAKGEENTNKESSSKKKTNVSEVKKETLKKGKREDEEAIVDTDLEDFGEEVLEKAKKPQTKKKIKKSDLFLIIGLLIAVLLGCFLMNGGKEEVSYQLPLTLAGDKGLQLLSYSEYQQKIDNNESFVVILSRESCSHCANFLPVAKEFALEKNVPMYYIDTDTFTEEEWSTFESSNTFLKKNKGNWGTPTTVVLAGREAVDYIEGETTVDKLINLYNQYFDSNLE